MFDLSLGGPIKERGYGGPLLRGKTLHEGSCWDSPSGCSFCNDAATLLSDEDLTSIGRRTITECEWCKKDVSIRDIRRIRPSDEGGSVEYEVCGECSSKHYKREEEEYEEE